MANKKDTCTQGFLVNDLGKEGLNLPAGVTVETIESIGYGQGLSFWLSVNDVIEFPKLEELRIDLESFAKASGEKGYSLVGRVYLSSIQDYTWMPISILRKIPCNDYREYLTDAQSTSILAPLAGATEEAIKEALAGQGLLVDKDGKLYRPINEEQKFFANYALGRELAARNQSDIGIYRMLAGKKLKVKECVLLHRHNFDYNLTLKKYVRLDTFAALLCYVFEYVAPKK